MKITVLILILPSFFKILSLLYNTYGHFSSKFSQKLLDLDYEIFDNFVFSLKVLHPLMATAGVCELCSLLAILTFVLLNPDVSRFESNVDPDQLASEAN